MQFRKLTLTLFIALQFVVFSGHAQKKAASLSPEDVKKYTEQCGEIIQYLQGTLNFLGDPSEPQSDKDIIINQSYLKIFLDDKVQIEDDLDAHRMMALNKDVQAYLKDIVFFYKTVTFNFEIIKTEQLVNQNGQIYFKVTMNRNLQGITIENDSVSNNQVRYVEINLDPAKQDLKIVSMYTTQPNKRDELKYWWVQMADSWKKYFGKNILIYDTIPFSAISGIGDSSFSINRWAENIRMDTMIAFQGDTVYPLNASDSARNFGKRVLAKSIHYVPVSDSFPYDVALIYKTLQEFRAATSVDISGDLNFQNLNPLSELSDLTEINISNTVIDDLSPLRNLNDLQKLNISGTRVTSLDALRYASSLKELNASRTRVKHIEVLAFLKNLDKINLRGSLADSLEPLSKLENLQLLNLSGLPISNIIAISNLPKLSDLNISSTQVSNLDAIQTLANLQNLYIDSTSISNLSPLSKLGKLALLHADYTPISDLAPLDKLSSLKFIYCDNSKIDRAKAEQFQNSNPGCMVVYNSAALKQWWNELPAEWKNIALTKLNIAEPISKEQLHLIVDQTSVNVSNNAEIVSIEPLHMLHRLENLNVENTKVSDLSPLSGLGNLRQLNISRTQVTSLEPLANQLNLKTVNCSQTGISDLLPLQKNDGLQIIYCDSTQVNQENVLALQEFLPACLVVYQSTNLNMWWNSLNEAWRKVFADAGKFEGDPSREQLQALVDLGSISIVQNPSLENLEPLTYFKRIKQLSIDNCGVSDILPLTTLISLTELSLPNNPLINLGSLDKLTKLTTLNLENTSLEDLDVLGLMNWVKSLNIAGTKIKKLKGIETMTSLETLVLNNTQIKSLKGIEDLPNLKGLTCYRTGISNKNIEAFKEEYPQVKVAYY